MTGLELEREERILADVGKLICPLTFPVTEYRIRDGAQPDGFCCDTSGWAVFHTSENWPEPGSHRWFRTTLTIPEAFEGRYAEFVVRTGREGQWDATNPQMLFYLNGELVQGVDVNHRRILLSPCASAGAAFDIAFLAYSGTVPGDLTIHTDLCAKDLDVERLYYDFSVPVAAARLLSARGEDDCRRILLKTSHAADLLDLREPYSEKFYDSLSAASEFLKREFYTDVDAGRPVVSAIGHTHIDLAWLWTVGQAREKALRSFSTVLELMRRYPGYKFMSSQPVLYQFFKEQAPELYREIKRRVRENRWEIDGAMWLESDCNIPSGESLVRQILKGHRFFLEEFGRESKSLWLPDAFGYNAALPQILKKSGISYFMTTKLAWNDSNQLPNDTFLWRGIDGSEVFAFLPTTSNYNGALGKNPTFSDLRGATTYTGFINPNMTLGTYDRFRNKDLTEDTLMLYGYGDGGGGPTAEMLENAERLKYGLPGLPRIRLEFESDFFDRAFRKIAARPDMPTWDGELYFENHRGTYTSAGKNKRNNRKSEILYEQLETLSVLNGRNGFPYPERQLRDGWDVILLNQFHDILPGSCIGEVYRTTDAEYARIRSDGGRLMREQMEFLASRVTAPEPSVLVFNSLGYVRDDLVAASAPFPVCGVRDAQGNSYDVQYLDDTRFLFFARGIPAVGYKVFSLIRGARPDPPESASFRSSFENAWYRVAFDRDGTILSLVEKKTEKELIRRGRRGNELQAFEDRPAEWDNWNLDAFYRRKPYAFDSASEGKVLESGPVRFCLEFKRTLLRSTLVQRICLYRDIPRIDFENEVDWRQNNVLLRVNFPVDVNATRAAFEIQFGNLERETTNNNSWDSARFEVCGHKWADLSENSVGLSLLNDCKYGYSAKNGDLGLSLIKAGTYPNADADIGMHRFTYSVYPHSGRWQEAETIRMAYNLNVPLHSAPCGPSDGALPGEFSLVCPSCENCFVEMLKQAEDGDGVILRVYENRNSEGTAAVRLGSAPGRVEECDLMERRLGGAALEGNVFRFPLKPYEIKTFRIFF